MRLAEGGHCRGPLTFIRECISVFHLHFCVSASLFCNYSRNAFSAVGVTFFPHTEHTKRAVVQMAANLRLFLSPFSWSDAGPLQKNPFMREQTHSYPATKCYKFGNDVLYISVSMLCAIRISKPAILLYFFMPAFFCYLLPLSRVL